MRPPDEQPPSRAGRDLLLLVLRRTQTSASARRARSMATTGAIEDMVDLARNHRVLGLLGPRAAAAGIDLPPTARDEISVVRHRSTGQHLLARRTIAVVGAALRTRHIVLKGPVLAVAHHDDNASRMYSDVDVLVDRDAFLTALDRLADRGFRSRTSNWSGFLDHGVAEVPLGHAGGLLDVDLHFHTVGLARDRHTLRVDTNAMMDRAVPVRLGDTTTMTADVVDTLLHLCVNIGLDGARGLRGLLDVDAVMAAASPDHTAVVSRARSTRVQPLVATVMQRCAVLLDTPGAGALAERLETGLGWLAANRLLDSTRRRPLPGRGLSPGWLLAAGRHRHRDTAAALWRAVAEELRARRSGSTLTGAGGDLDWRSGDGSRAAFRAYMQWIDERPSLRVDAERDPIVLHDLLREHQPRSTPLVSAATHAMADRARIRRWVVRDEDGQFLAAVVAQRVALGITPAYVVLVDPRAAAPIGRLLDQVGATTVAGFEPDLAPLRGTGSRWRHEAHSTAAALEPGFVWEPPTVATRRATPDDVEALLAVRRASTPGRLPSSRLLRPFQTTLVADITLILPGADDEPVGFIARQARTPEWDVWGHMEIVPEHRGQGYAWQLLAGAAALTRQRDAGGMVFVAATNPMPLPTDAVLPDPWLTVTLSPPRRFRGEPRLHRLLGRLRRGPADGPTVDVVRSAGRHDTLVTIRRTQRWWAAEHDQE